MKNKAKDYLPMKTVKPCPFCGSLKLEIGKRTRSILMYVLCLDCEAQGPASDVEKVAIYLWNDWQDRILQEE